MRLLPAIVAMAAVVVASNILVQVRLGPWLTWGALTYPLAFLVTDITNRLHGPAAARRVVLWGFAAGLACSAVGTQVQGAFGPLVTMRVALASGAAFLAAQFLDIAVFNRLARGRWWRAPLIGSLVASTLDTALFFTIAFAGPLAFLEPGNDVGWANAIEPLVGLGPAAPLWVSLALADWAVKLAIAVLALLPFRLAVARLAAPIA